MRLRSPPRSRKLLAFSLLLVARGGRAAEAAEAASEAPSSEPGGGPIFVDDWPADRPVPPGYRRVTEPRAWAVTLGTNAFTLAYLAVAIGSVLEVKASGDTEYWWGVAPLAGPFVLLRDAKAPYVSAALWADGAVQGAGALLAALGLAFPITRLVRHVGVSQLGPAPMVTHDTLGFGVGGRF